MRRAVAEYAVLGIRTTLPFFGRVLRDPAFVSGDSTPGSSSASWPAGAPPSDERADSGGGRGGRARAARRGSAAPQTRPPPARARPGGARDWRDLGAAR
jgi:acetyl/propionyl-CoA carboxylase alpha subunit